MLGYPVKVNVLDVLRNYKVVIYERTNERTELHQFRNNLTMMVMYLPVNFEFDWTNRF